MDGRRAARRTCSASAGARARRVHSARCTASSISTKLRGRPVSGFSDGARSHSGHADVVLLGARGRPPRAGAAARRRRRPTRGASWPDSHACDAWPMHTTASPSSRSSTWPTLPSDAVPELPEVETIRRQLAPLVEGRTLAALEISDPRWCLPLRARGARGRARRSPGRAASAAAASTCSGERAGRRHAAHAPAHDRDAALRRRGRDAVPPGPHDPRRRAHAELLRPAPLRDGRARGRRATRCDDVPRRAPRRRAAGPRLHDRAAAHPRARPARAGQGVPARPAPHRRASGTSTPTRRCSAPASIRSRRRGGCGAPSSRRCATRCASCSRPGSTRAARRSTTSATPTACAAPSRTSSWCTAAAARACPVCGDEIVKLVAAGRGHLRVPDLPAPTARRANPVTPRGDRLTPTRGRRASGPHPLARPAAPALSSPRLVRIRWTTSWNGRGARSGCRGDPPNPGTLGPSADD